MKKLVVISVDSLFTSDLDKVKHLPGFKDILTNSIIVENMECVYPTLTYPCHATIMTGVYPKTHGIYHNEILNPSIHNQEWYWHYKDLKVKTIFDIAKENKLTTAAMCWPVTAKGPIDYLLPEIWTLDVQKDNPAIVKNASKKAKEVYYRHAHLLDWKDNLALDTFAEACAIDVVDRFEPDVLFIHQATLDHARHVYGVQHKKVDEALLKHGYWIENLINTYKRKGLFDKTVFVILGDHGQLNIKRVVSLNEMFRRAGLIKTDGLGNILDYDAYVQSSAISGHVYIKNNQVKLKVLEILNEAKHLGYIEQIFNSSQFDAMHLEGPFDYIVECTPYYSISNEVDGDIVSEINEGDYKNARATHGHLPYKGDKPPFIIYNSTLPSRQINEGKLVDIYPTLLKLLGLVIPEGIEGTPLI